MMETTNTLYTIQQAKNNAKPYKGYFIGTMSLVGDGRYATYLFDKDMNEIISFIGSIKDMKEYVDGELLQVKSQEEVLKDE